MINIGKRRELFVDDYILDTERTTAELKLHHPVRHGDEIVMDGEGEGNVCGYPYVFYSEGKWRMYHRCGGLLPNGEIDPTCRIGYRESEDGIHWVKPELGIIEYNGSKKNNFILDTEFAKQYGVTHLCGSTHVFYDNNPACLPDEKYKMVICTEGDDKLISMVSSDGIHFKNYGLVSDDGAFDSLNLAFWSEEHGKYFCYFRGEHVPDETVKFEEFSYLQAIANRLWDPVNLRYRDPEPDDVPFMRDVRVTTSEDFKTWTAPMLIGLKDDRVQLYTNNVIPYPRAPHIFVGFPVRYNERKAWTPNYDELCGLEDRIRRRDQCTAREGLVVTDCLFMCSRDGYNFNRYDEAFLRPPVEHEYSWVYGDCYMAQGLVETASDIPGADTEYSFYVSENWRAANGYNKFARYTIRKDGFVSLYAPFEEKMAYTKEFLYTGTALYANIETSGRGHVYFTLISDGVEYPSYEIFGNSTDKRIRFLDDGAVARLSGKPVVLKMSILDGDVYSFKFE